MSARYAILIIFLVVIVAIILYLVFRNANALVGSSGVAGTPVMLVTPDTEAVTISIISPYNDIVQTGSDRIITLQAAAFELKQNLPSQYFLLQQDKGNPNYVCFQSNLNQRYARIVQRADVTLIAFDAKAPLAASINNAQWFEAIVDPTVSASNSYKFRSLALNLLLAKGPLIPSTSSIYLPSRIPIDPYFPLTLSASGASFTLLVE